MIIRAIYNVIMNHAYVMNYMHFLNEIVLYSNIANNKELEHFGSIVFISSPQMV